MRHPIRLLATVIATLLACAALTTTTTSPAAAESVTLWDPAGDADGYDITKLRVRHKSKRVTFELRQDQTPYWYEIRVDTPGPKKTYDYVVTWSIYGQRKVYVQTKKDFEDGGSNYVCRNKTAEVADDNSVLTFSVSRSCFGPPKSVRVKAIAWDDQFGWKDRTGWTERAGVA